MKRYLRLTGGSFTGRKLYVPDIGVRPATNLVREAIFSTLSNMFEDGIEGLSFLDLYAGTGSLGLEAISRGASRVTFIDNSRASIVSIKRNMELLGFSGSVIKSDVSNFLKRNRNLKYDVIFFDPPYKLEDIDGVLELLGMAIDSQTSPILVYERFYKKELPDLNKNFELLKRKKYGQTEVLYYRISNGLKENR